MTFFYAGDRGSVILFPLHVEWYKWYFHVVYNEIFQEFSYNFFSSVQYLMKAILTIHPEMFFIPIILRFNEAINHLIPSIFYLPFLAVAIRNWMKNCCNFFLSFAIFCERVENKLNIWVKVCFFSKIFSFDVSKCKCVCVCSRDSKLLSNIYFRDQCDLFTFIFIIISSLGLKIFFVVDCLLYIKRDHISVCVSVYKYSIESARLTCQITEQ